MQSFLSVYDPLKSGSIDGSIDRPHDKAVTRAIKSVYRNRWKQGDPEKTVFVARLDSSTSQSTLERFFSRYGRIKKCTLIRDIVTGMSKRYAFIEYYHRSDSKYAIEKAHGVTIDGRKILVDHERQRLMEGWKPRRLGGGFGGNKKSGQLRFGGKDRPFRQPVMGKKIYNSKKKLNLKRKRDAFINSFLLNK